MRGVQDGESDGNASYCERENGRPGGRVESSSPLLFLSCPGLSYARMEAILRTLAAYCGEGSRGENQDGQENELTKAKESGKVEESSGSQPT